MLLYNLLYECKLEYMYQFKLQACSVMCSVMYFIKQNMLNNEDNKDYKMMTVHPTVQNVATSLIDVCTSTGLNTGETVARVREALSNSASSSMPPVAAASTSGTLDIWS